MIEVELAPVVQVVLGLLLGGVPAAAMQAIDPTATNLLSGYSLPSGATAPTHHMGGGGGGGGGRKMNQNASSAAQAQSQAAVQAQQAELAALQVV